MNDRVRINFKSNGFTVIEALVGLGLVAIVSTGIMAAINSSLLATKGVESGRNASSLNFGLKEMFSKQQNCTGNLQNKIINSTTTITQDN
jgi:hypothetical protein